MGKLTIRTKVSDKLTDHINAIAKAKNWPATAVVAHALDHFFLDLDNVATVFVIDTSVLGVVHEDVKPEKPAKSDDFVIYSDKPISADSFEPFTSDLEQHIAVGSGKYYMWDEPNNILYRDFDPSERYECYTLEDAHAFANQLEENYRAQRR